MEKETYLPATKGGRWAICRHIAGKNVYLVERAYMDDSTDIERIFRALYMADTRANRSLFFPANNAGQPCPTLELLELVAEINNQRPAGSEIGV